MVSVVIAESFVSGKKAEYIRFAEQLGSDVCFSDDKWLCDKLRRSPAQYKHQLTLYFSEVPAQCRDMVKYFSVICIIRGKTMNTVKSHITGLTKFFDFWIAEYKTVKLHICDEFAAAKFRQYLERYEFAETSKSGIWRSANAFFKIMSEWDDEPFKNPFSVSPFYRQTKYECKYIPENVALQLDKVFTSGDIVFHLRCVYWLLRLIPSRISEILGIRIDCLKRYNGHYVLFIPTWKQNGGRREPIMRCIHLEDTGIAGHLIHLIKMQQDVALRLQKYMPDAQKGVLLTYQQVHTPKGQSPFHVGKYCVFKGQSVGNAFKKICERHGIVDGEGRIYELTSHQFRHNGITDRLAAGFTAAQIAEMTGHHGSAMIFESYAHLNLLPETILEKQEYVLQEANGKENRYILFGGRILNMEEQLENYLLRNLRAHRVRGGICGDITGCKSDMWNCLDCKFFVPDAEQLDYYEEQARLWREKSVKFSDFPVIKGNAEKNAELYERVLKKLREGQDIL